MFLLLVFVLEPRERELCEGRVVSSGFCVLWNWSIAETVPLARVLQQEHTPELVVIALKPRPMLRGAKRPTCCTATKILHMCVFVASFHFSLKATYCDEPPSSVVEDVSPLFTCVLVLCFLSWLQEAERDSLLILKGAEVEKQAMLKASKSAPTPEAKAGAAATELKAEPKTEPKAEPAKTKPAAS